MSKIVEDQMSVCSSKFTRLFGVCALTLGAIIALFWMQFCEFLFYKEMQLTPTSRVYEKWRKPPIPLYMDIYFFNWTNPEDFYNHSTKPIFKEIGPYRFQEKPEKINITWNQNSTVSYKMMSTFFFDEAGSVGKLNDSITTINIVSVSAAARSRFWSFIEKRGVSIGLALYSEKLHVTKTAGQLMFDGYEDSMVQTVKKIFNAKEVPFDKFGWFYMRNASGDLLGEYNVHTGVSDFSKLGVIQRWNYDSRTEYFPDKCGELYGSMGEFYPPHLSRNQPISVFSADMCRSLKFDYEEDIDVHGIKAYKYSGGPKLVDNGTMHIENTCFCAGECMPSGVLNISACRYGSPVFMSFPHYLHADSFYREQVVGMNPQKKKHEFYVGLEPTTGAPLELAARFQVNVLIRPDSDLRIFKNIKETFMPVLWFEQYVKMDESTASDFKLVLAIPMAGKIFGLFLGIVGVLVLFLIPAINAFRKSKLERNNNKQQNATNQAPKEASPLLIDRFPSIQNAVNSS